MANAISTAISFASSGAMRFKQGEIDSQRQGQSIQYHFMLVVGDLILSAQFRKPK
jgi:hypothetical protein